MVSGPIGPPTPLAQRPVPRVPKSEAGPVMVHSSVVMTVKDFHPIVPFATYGLVQVS